MKTGHFMRFASGWSVGIGVAHGVICGWRPRSTQARGMLCDDKIREMIHMPRDLESHYGEADLGRLDSIDRFNDNAAFGGEIRDGRMAKGFLRKDLLGGLEESELFPPDFFQIFSLAEKVRKGDLDKTPNISSERQTLADLMAPDFESFSQLAKSFALELSLVELAIIDNDSLERYDDARAQAATKIIGVKNHDDQPKFVSAIAAFTDFKKNNRLLKAWDTATERVVTEMKRSIVGTPETYDYAYLWEVLSLSESVAPELPLDYGVDDEVLINRKTYMVESASGEKFRVGLPEFYPFGTQTSSETSKSGIQREPSRDLPLIILNRLLTYFHEVSVEELQDASIRKLDHAILIIVPFTRPRLYQSDDLTDSKILGNVQHQKSGDRAGGGVFILCRDLFDTDETSQELNSRLREQGLNEQEARIRRLAVTMMWLMHRSAMLEARLERNNKREEDLGEYFHLIAKSLRRLRTNVYRAASSSEDYKLPENVQESLASAEVVTKRLEELGKIARQAVLLRSGRSSPLSLDTFLDTSELKQCVESEITEAMDFAKNQGIQDEGRRSEIAHVTSHLEWNVPSIERIRTSRLYLNSLFGELFKNALEHGGFNGSKLITIEVFSRTLDEKTYIVMSVSNPLRDPKAGETLREVFRKRHFYLGLSQIEMLAEVYNLNQPHFAVEGNEAVVYCFLGIA